MSLRSILCGCVAGAVCAPLAAASINLTLRPAVLLDHSRIVLADLAEVRAAPPLQATLARLELGKAPRVGYVDRLTRAELEMLVRRRLGTSLADLDWSGAAQVDVRTASRVIASAELARAAASQLRERLAASHPGLSVEAASAPADVEVPVGEYLLVLRPVPAGALAPRVAAWLDVLVDGATYRSVVVPLTLTSEREVMVARRPLAAGVLASRADFELRRENATGLDPVAPPDAGAAHWRLQRPIEAGQILGARDVASAGAVLPGDHVRLLMRSGPIGIEADAVALAAAAPGDMLGIVTPTSEEPLRGRLGAARTVIIE